jgi:starch phosphorylase
MQPGEVIAYFSMEVAVHADVPTYSGGLGVLAGDMLRSAADLRAPIVGVTLLHREGYLRQELDETGWQVERPVDWPISEHMHETGTVVSVPIEGREVRIRSWVYRVLGIGGGEVPVYFLDTDLSQNSDWDRGLTARLYGGDFHLRLCQEIVLGIGGVRMLRALGCRVYRFHMNEGHSALLTLELADESRRDAGRSAPAELDLETVRGRCVFTTHTPVAAGHDVFPMEHARRVLGNPPLLERAGGLQWDGDLNMTTLALRLSRYVNGVARRHGEVSRQMFPEYEVGSITNGIHLATWTSPPFQQLFDRCAPGWRAWPEALRKIASADDALVEEAHESAKRALLEHIHDATSIALDPRCFTIGFGRRFAAYKRPALLLSDWSRLEHVAAVAGDIQIVYAGKSHPRDAEGKRCLQKIYQLQGNRHPLIRVVFLKDYCMRVAGLMTSGVDVWLNTPRPPLEASGTSGMKAAANGVPSLSVLDGWWVEGCVDGITGWPIGDNQAVQASDHQDVTDANLLYERLEHNVLPLFYHDPARFTEVMKDTIAFNAPYFNTHRMLREYQLHAYLS